MIAFLLSLFTWANAPYTTALLVVGFSLVFQLVGLLPWSSDGHAGLEGHGEGDALGGHDAGGHALSDGHAGADSAADADAGPSEHDAGGHEAADHEAGDHGDHAEHADQEGGRGGVMAFLGVGKVPLAIVWQTLFVMFGLVGVSITTILAWTTGSLGLWLLAASAPGAIVGGVLLTTATVRLLARLIPATSGKAASRRDLVGLGGVVISSSVTDEFGEVRLQDPSGRTLRLICYTHAGEAAIPEGTEVVITDLDRAKDRLHVTSVDKLLDGNPRNQALRKQKKQPQ